LLQKATVTLSVFLVNYIKYLYTEHNGGTECRECHRLVRSTLSIYRVAENKVEHLIYILYVTHITVLREANVTSIV